MALENFFSQAIKGSTFSFTARPEPVAGDLRFSWGIGILLLSSVGIVMNLERTFRASVGTMRWRGGS